MRDYDFRYSPRLNQQGGAAAPGDVGDIIWSLTKPPGAWENALLPSPLAPLLASEYPKLYEMQGGLISRVTGVSPLSANNTANSSAVFNGFIYGITGGVGTTGQVKKRATAFGAYSAPVWTIPGVSTNLGRLFSTGTRLYAAVSNGSQSFIETTRTDTDRSAVVLLPNSTAQVPWRILQIAPGVAICCANRTLIWRTADDGASWQQITSNLGAVTSWQLMWKGTGNNVHIMGSAGQISTSTDQGLTWSAPVSPPGAQNMLISGSISQLTPSSAVGLSSRIGVTLTTGNVLLTFSLDNPTAGYTQALPTGALNGNLWATPTAFWGISTFAGLVGLWYAPINQPSAWRMMFSAAQWLTIIAPLTGAFNAAMFTPEMGLELADGRLTFDLSMGLGVPTDYPMCIQFADGTTTFDPYQIADPVLFNGMIPWRRIK